MSNFDVRDLEEAGRISGTCRPVGDQVLYHLKERAIDHSVIPWCEKHGVAVVASSPFGHGNFPGPRTEGGLLPARLAPILRIDAQFRTMDA